MGVTDFVGPVVHDIFTDGSKTAGGTSAAFVVFRGDTVVHKWLGRLRQPNSVFQAELAAISAAVEWTANASLVSTRIHTDSESSLKAIRNADHGLVEVREVQEVLQNASVPISIVWVKAHVGIIGNEIADLLARRALERDDSHEVYVPNPLSMVRHQLRSDLLGAWQDFWSLSDKGRDLFLFFPEVRREQRLVDRRLILFFTGHGPFLDFRLKVGLEESDLCVCGQSGTRWHYLFDCPITVNVHMGRPSASNFGAWCRALSSNKGAHTTIRDLISSLNVNLMGLKQAAP